MKINILDNKIIKDFITYLDNQGLGSLSIKNYQSDLTHFTNWIILKVRLNGIAAERLTECFPFLTKKTGYEYRNSLLTNRIPRLTINRRLSTLRHLARFLTQSQIIDFDFMEKLPNIELAPKKSISYPFLDEFERELKQNKASSNTIKSYLSDVRHFLTWLERTQASNI